MNMAMVSAGRMMQQLLHIDGNRSRSGFGGASGEVTEAR
jgi:hypothetical protein